VEQIYAQSFAHCGLKRIEIESGNKCYRIFNESIVTLTGERIIRYFGSDSEVHIPDVVEIIGILCFGQFRSIRRIFFGPNSQLRLIRTGAFEDCELLQSITIPSLGITLGSECFGLGRDSMSVLASITLSASVEIIEGGCFRRCNRLMTVTFPPDSKLRRIERQAFWGCSSLEVLCIPSCVEYVGKQCFARCNSLSSLVLSSPCRIRELLDLPPQGIPLNAIPDSVTVLGFSTEEYCIHQYQLTFGRESELARVITLAKRSFLSITGRSLKVLRSSLEFDQCKEEVDDS
jgi:hypothetical protein